VGGVGWGEIVDTLVVTAAIVVIDEGGDLGFEIAREEVVLQQMRFLRVWCQRSIRGGRCVNFLYRGRYPVSNDARKARWRPA